MPTRIYVVNSNDKDELIEASSKAAAVNHVARGTIKAKVASQFELLALLEGGVTVQKAGVVFDEQAAEEEAETLKAVS